MTTQAAPRETVAPARDPRPRVLYVLVRKDPEIYGGTRSILLAIERLRRVDPVVAVVATSPEDPALRELELAGVRSEFVAVPELLVGNVPKSALDRARKLAQLVACNRRISALIRRYDPDFLHVDAEGFLLVAGAAWGQRCRLVHHLRGRQAGRVSPVRQVALALAHRNVAISPSLAEHYRLGCAPWLRRRVAARTEVVYNGLRVDEIAAYQEAHSREWARSGLGIPEGHVAIGIVGGIFGAKGQREFLEQVAPEVTRRDPRVHLYFVGGVKDAAYGEACQAAVRKHGLEARVTFAGYQSDVYRWYRALDAVAFPSVREGFGRVAAEAQAFGVPVVASDIVGLRDAVEDGGGGFLVRDASETTGRLLRLAADSGLRERMGRDGRAFARRFDLDAVTRDLEAVYLEPSRSTHG